MVVGFSIRRGLSCSLIGITSYICYDKYHKSRSPPKLSFGGVSYCDSHPAFELKSVLLYFTAGQKTPTKYSSVLPSIDWSATLHDIESSKFFHPVQITDPTSSSDKIPPSPTDNVEQMCGYLKGGATRGALTNQGCESMFLLGKALKDAYIDSTQLYPYSYYNSDLIKTKSANIDRNIKSAACLLNGMFSNHIPSSCNPCVEVQDHMNDLFMCQASRFSEVKRWMNWAKESQLSLPGMIKFHQSLAEALKVDDWKQIENVLNVHDILSSMKDRFGELDNQYESIYGKLSRYAAAIERYRSCPDNIRMSTFINAPLFTDLLKVLKRCVTLKNGSSFQPIHVYSGTEAGMIGLLGALDKFDGDWPSSPSFVAIELYQRTTDSKWFIHVVYNDYSFGSLQLKTNKVYHSLLQDLEESNLMSYDEFVEKLEKYVHKNDPR